MTMGLVMMKIINNFPVSVELRIVVGILSVRALGGELIKSLEKKLISNFF